VYWTWWPREKSVVSAGNQILPISKEKIIVKVSTTDLK
jgi:hypothetical protein